MQAFAILTAFINCKTKLTEAWQLCSYKRNGILPMLKRNSMVKHAPQRWQDNAADGSFDIVFTFEEKVFDMVIEGWYVPFCFPIHLSPRNYVVLCKIGYWFVADIAVDCSCYFFHIGISTAVRIVNSFKLCSICPCYKWGLPDVSKPTLRNKAP